MTKRIYLSPPDMSDEDRQMLLSAFDSGWIAPLGPDVDAFEQEMAGYVGTGHAAALSSGTAALHLGLLLLGVEPGDTVLCSTLTFSATANAIRYCGANPIFIDSDRISWNMDCDLLEEELEACASRGKLPKAVVVVDLYGQSAHYSRIEEICERYEVPLIEDAAEALGAWQENRRAGTFGKLSILSFNGNKIITTSGGGMLLSDSEAIVSRARFLATQARDPAPHYQHSVVGYNYRMSNLLAALGRSQLRQLEGKIERRRKNFLRYREGLSDLPGLSFMPEPEWSNATRWLTCLTIDPQASGVSSEEIRIHLESHNIESRPIWKPMHMQPVFQECRVAGGRVSQYLFEHGLCLPSGSNLDREDMERVIDAIQARFNRPVAAPPESAASR